MKNGSPTPTDAAYCPRDSGTGEPLAPTATARLLPRLQHPLAESILGRATRERRDETGRTPPPYSSFLDEQWGFWTAVFAHLIPQTDRDS